MKSEGELYILNTQYQLLITLLKVDKWGKDSIVVVNRLLDQHTEEILNKENIVNNIVYINESIFSLKEGSVSKRRKLKLMLKKFREINIFIDHFTIGAYLNKYRIPYHVIEDGYNFFSYDYKDFRDKVFKKKAHIQDYKEFIKHILFCKKNKPGFGKYCQSIEVNDISVVPKDKRYHKFKEVPRKELFNNISEERKQLILRVFDVEELSEVEDKSVLILTQPLSIDGLMNSDDKQYGFYKKICDKYLSEGYEVYLKPHPRDSVTYENINKVKIISQSVPMELIEMVSNVKFEKIVTHSSTAINFLECGKEKEIFFDFNTRVYNEQLLEKYNINKDEI